MRSLESSAKIIDSLGLLFLKSVITHEEIGYIYRARLKDFSSNSLKNLAHIIMTSLKFKTHYLGTNNFSIINIRLNSRLYKV